MLRVARGGVAGDMRHLPFRRKFARITCLYDSLNHLLNFTSGLKQDDATFLAYSGNRYYFALKQPNSHPPGSTFALRLTIVS